MSSRYGSVKHGRRPIVANNVLGLLKKRAHICSAARLFVHNVVIDGTGCSASDQVGPADLDGRGRPRRTSSWSTPLFAATRPGPTRPASPAGAPDIGALSTAAAEKHAAATGPPLPVDQTGALASYTVNDRAVARARRADRESPIRARQRLGDVQPRAEQQNAYLASHSWDSS